MKPLVLFSSLAVLCAGGLMALSYQGLQDDPSALTKLSSGSQTVNIKSAEAVSTPPPAAQPAETATAAAPKAEEAPKTEEKVAAVEPKETETAPSAEPAPEVKLGDDTAQPETGEVKQEGASFDIVRVEEDGSAVLAGRAEPGATVRLLINQKIAGETKANDRGEWVVIPAELMPAGAHQMQIETVNAAGEVTLAKQSVALTVPDKPGTQPLIVLSETAKPSKVLQKPETAEVKQAEADEEAPDQQAAGESKTAALQPPASATAPAVNSTGRSLNVDVVDYNEAGLTTFSGRSAPNSTVRVYVDDVYTGAAVAGSDGTWSFTASNEIAAGPHRLRTDQIAADGSVSERIELPFFRESAERIASLQAQRQTAAGQQQATSETEPAAAAEPEQSPAGSSQPDSNAEVAEAETEADPTGTEAPATSGTAGSGSVTSSGAEATDEPEVAEAQPTSENKEDAVATKPEDAPAAAEPQQTQQVAAADTSAEPSSTGQTAASGTSGETTIAKTTEQQVAAVEPEAEPVKPADLIPGTEDDEPAQQVTEPETATSTETAAVTTTGAGQAESAEPVTGRVVIQPGNNLWQISRVIYGQGRQYTVIYDANKDQIRDPDRIYPGQIFDTPGSNAPESIDPSCRRPLAECE